LALEVGQLEFLDLVVAIDGGGGEVGGLLADENGHGNLLVLCARVGEGADCNQAPKCCQTPRNRRNPGKNPARWWEVDGIRRPQVHSREWYPPGPPAP